VREKSTAKAQFAVRLQDIGGLRPYLRISGIYVEGTLDAYSLGSTEPWVFLLDPDDGDFLCDVIFCTLDHDYIVRDNCGLESAGGIPLNDVYCLFLAREEVWDRVSARFVICYHCLLLEMVQCDRKAWTVEDQARWRALSTCYAHASDPSRPYPSVTRLLTEH